MNRNLPYHILLFFVIVLATIGAVQAKNVEFSDDFNRANNVYVGNNWIEINDGDEGDYYYLMIDSNQVRMAFGGTHAELVRHFTPAITNNTIQMHFNITRNNTDFIIQIEDETKGNLTYISRLTSNNSLALVTGGGLDVRDIADWETCLNGTYHNLTLKNINYVTKTFDVWFDGSETNLNVPFYQENFTGIDNFTIFWVSSDPHFMYWDDIEFYQLDAEEEDGAHGALLFFIGITGLLFVVLITWLGLNHKVFEPFAVVFAPWVLLLLVAMAINMSGVTGDLLANLETFYTILAWTASFITLYMGVYYVHKVLVTFQMRTQDAKEIY